MTTEQKKLVSEAIRYLTLALIGARAKPREYIEKAIECLSRIQN